MEFYISNNILELEINMQCVYVCVFMGGGSISILLVSDCTSAYFQRNKG